MILLTVQTEILLQGERKDGKLAHCCGGLYCTVCGLIWNIWDKTRDHLTAMIIADHDRDIPKLETVLPLNA